MHTFFINTSHRELNVYDTLFDIHYESKTLVSMNCFMSDWYDKDKGYRACIRQMSEMIDAYVELNNAFNLIVYIDLPEFKQYSSIPRGAEYDNERDECCRAMHILFTHVLSGSIVQELDDSGRKPQNILIMFGEEKAFTDFLVARDDPQRNAVMREFYALMGLPQSDTVKCTAKDVHNTDAEDKVALFENRIFELCKDELIPGIRDKYNDELHLWCDQVINEENISGAEQDLFDRINSIYEVEGGRKGVHSVSCPYDCYACEVNLSVLALSNLNIALFLLKCVELNSIFESTNEEKKLIAFRSYTAQEIAPILSAKKGLYEQKFNEIQSLSGSYAELKLAPKLRSFDHEKFGLDKYGAKAIDLVINEVVPKSERPGKRDDASEEADNGKHDGIIKDIDHEVILGEKQGRTLFLKSEYQAFDDYYEEDGRQTFEKNATPEQYIERAKMVRKHHLDYLKKLKNHVSRVMSNYAGRSKENKPALLQVGEYRYASPGEKDETDVLETVEDVANKAYKSMTTQYMEFCAGRSVAISDIEEQCNWFVSRVTQIRESLKKIKMIAMGLLIGVLLLYLPFVLIQVEAIVENELTIAIALGSIIVPLILLYFIVAIVTTAQRKKYLKAWNDFEEKSRQALNENRIAVKKYDQLLSTVIPAFRWVYEYKLDVDYCVECCRIADAKIAHHKQKLFKRVQFVQNLIKDLDITGLGDDNAQSRTVNTAGLIDYSVSFCSNSKNRKFYSIIDREVLLPTDNQREAERI